MIIKTNFQNVNEYIGSFPEEVQPALEQIRQAIKKAVPGAEEVISHQIPAFKYNGWQVYFSACEEHFSVTFPPPFTVFEVFRKELLPYELSKTTVQFPVNEQVPMELISGMVSFRAQENLEL